MIEKAECLLSFTQTYLCRYFKFFNSFHPSIIDVVIVVVAFDARWLNSPPFNLVKVLPSCLCLSGWSSWCTPKEVTNPYLLHAFPSEQKWYASRQIVATEPGGTSWTQWARATSVRILTAKASATGRLTTATTRSRSDMRVLRENLTQYCQHESPLIKLGVSRSSVTLKSSRSELFFKTLNMLFH